MKSLRRLASHRICTVLSAVLREDQKEWARAVRTEADTIQDDGEALLFAIDVFRGIVVSRAYELLHRGRSTTAASSFLFPRLRSIPMANNAFGNFSLRSMGALCAIGAVLLGLAYLLAAGAPVRLVAINVAALIIGLSMMTIQMRVPVSLARQSGVVILLLGSSLMATAVSGLAADGATRWIAIGPLAMQPSLIILPMMIVMYVHDRGPAATAGMLIAALAMAMQPDRAMAGVLMCGLVSLAIMRRDRTVLVALAASVAAFAITMVRPDQLPASAYVDQIFYTAFDVHLLAGLAVLVGTGLLLVPAVYGIRSGSVNRDTSVVFAIVWLTIIIAAALGNYPTPVVGYGGSAILGYLLSLGIVLRPASIGKATNLPAHIRSNSNDCDVNSVFAPNLVG